MWIKERVRLPLHCCCFDLLLKGHVNPKIQVTLVLRKKWREKRILRSFCSIRLSLGIISSFSTEIPLPVKTIASDRDVTGGTQSLLNMHSVWRLVQVAVVRRMFPQKGATQLP